MSFFTGSLEDAIDQPKQLTISSHFNLVHNIITSHCRWFIAGGSLLVDNGDLDIYFYRGQDFITALYCFDHNNDVHRSSHSDNAVTFMHQINGSLIQLIFRNFGDPQTIIDNFDLNKSAQAVDHNGHTYRSADFFEPLCIRTNQFRWNTVARFDKYIYSKRQLPSREALFSLFTEMLANHNKQLDNYYSGGSDVYLLRHSSSFILSALVYPHFVAYLHTLPIDDAIFFMQNIINYNVFFIPQLTDPSFFVEYLLRLADPCIRPYIPSDVVELFPEWSI